MRRRGFMTFVGVVASLAACAGEPESVFVPGSGFRESLFVTSEQGARASVSVGEPLALHAERLTGPWLMVPRDSVPEGGCWLAAPPAEYEGEVAAEIRWTAQPPVGATFNVGLREDLARDVTFHAPGRYRIVGESVSACGGEFGGDTIVVVVSVGG